MTETKHYVKRLFEANAINITLQRNNLYDDFVNNSNTVEKVEAILNNQNAIMKEWKIISEIADMLSSSVQIANGTVGKNYEFKVDFSNNGWENISYLEIEGLQDFGLTFDMETHTISGIPNKDGDFEVRILFRINEEVPEAELHEKKVKVLINPDPKSLWKNIPSSSDCLFPKQDDVQDFAPLGQKHIVVASKRGRSHANVGSFRDDDYRFQVVKESGWSIVAVSDGAGSSKFSRKGSELACNEVASYLQKGLVGEQAANLDQLLWQIYSQNTPSENHESIKDVVGVAVDDQLETNPDHQIGETDDSPTVILNRMIYNILGGCANSAFKSIEKFANNSSLSIKEFHATLIFALFKKFDFGYVILTFGVGDCPIALINKEMTQVKMMNWLDVGEYGGGTRFITMPEIFTSDTFPTRFGFTMVEDFSYLMLMTDGIYDAKFVVEANLEKVEKWKEFLEDLNGCNEEKATVAFEIDNTQIATQLSTWMDFWSPGNHDDRTLAIIF